MAFLHLGTLNSTSALGLGAALKSKITTKKKKEKRKEENVVVDRPQKGRWFAARELKQ